MSLQKIQGFFDNLRQDKPTYPTPDFKRWMPVKVSNTNKTFHVELANIHPLNPVTRIFYAMEHPVEDLLLPPVTAMFEFWRSVEDALDPSTMSHHPVSLTVIYDDGLAMEWRYATSDTLLRCSNPLLSREKRQWRRYMICDCNGHLIMDHSLPDL